MRHAWFPALAGTTFLFVSAHAAGRLPADVTVLSKERFIGTNFHTVEDALIALTDLNVEKTGNRGTRAVLKARGGSADQVQVLLDGRPIGFEFDGAVDLSQIPIAMAERIEITRGSASHAYSSESVAATVNIVTARPPQKGLVTRLDYGIGRNGGRMLNGRFLGRNRWADFTYVPSLQDAGGYLFNEELESTSHFGNLSRSFNGKGYWGVEYFFHDSEIGVPNGTAAPLEEWNGRLEREPVDRLAVRKQEMQHVKGILQSPEIGGVVIRAEHTHRLRDSDHFDRPHGVSLDDRNRVAETTTLDLKWRGWELGGERRAQKRVLFPGHDRKTLQSSVYLLNKWEGGKLTLLPSVRYEHHSNFNAQVNPRLAAVFSPLSFLSFSGSAARVMRVPTFDEFFDGTSALPNPDLEPETGMAADLGASIHPGAGFELVLTGYARRIKDLILVRPATNRYENFGEEKANGLETRARLETLPESRYFHFTIEANWTIQKTERDFKDGNGFVPAALTPRHIGLGRVTFHGPGQTTLANEIRYQSEQFEDPNETGLRVPAYTVWNIRFALRVLAADLYFTVENVLQKRYADTLVPAGDNPSGPSTTVLSPQPDRTYWAGFSIRFLN